MTLVTYPLNNVEYQAEDAELFHCTRNSGIYAGDDFAYSVTGADNSIVINPGVGWIRNNRFSGKVFAMRAAQSIDLGLPDSVYPRIDAIVIRFEANSNQTELVVKTGIPSSSPTAPTVSQTESLYELHLYHVYREAGAVSFSVADITDLRMNANYCGLMADSVTSVDISAINAQIEALVVQLREDILAVKTGSAYVMRDGTTAMAGDLGMGGHRVTNMAAPEEDGDAVSLGYAKQHFGGSNIADSTYPDCYYRMVDGVKEWINPPMVVGVEYRTLERHKGKPVYVKAVDLGKLPAANAKITVPYVSVTATPIRAFAVASDRKMIPSVYYSASTDTRMEVNLSLENNNVSVYSTHDKSNATGVATVWYIKE